MGNVLYETSSVQSNIINVDNVFVIQNHSSTLIINI